MKLAVIFSLFLLVSQTGLASDCEQRYQQAEQSHDAVVNQEQGSEQFFKDLAALEDHMFASMQACKNDARLLALMAEIQITARQAPLAQLYAKKALDLDPRAWQSQHAMGSVLTLVQDYEQAIKHLEKASQLAPQRTGLKLSLCRTQALAKKSASAIKTCTQVINGDDASLHALAYYLRSLAYKGIHEEVQAQQDLEKARQFGIGR